MYQPRKISATFWRGAIAAADAVTLIENSRRPVKSVGLYCFAHHARAIVISNARSETSVCTALLLRLPDSVLQRCSCRHDTAHRSLMFATLPCIRFEIGGIAHYQNKIYSKLYVE